VGERRISTSVCRLGLRHCPHRRAFAGARAALHAFLGAVLFGDVVSYTHIFLARICRQFFFSEKRYRVLISEMSSTPFFWSAVFCVIVLIVWLNFPCINAYLIQPKNELASFEQLLYLFEIIGLSYLNGRILGAIQLRQQLNSKKGK